MTLIVIRSPRLADAVQYAYQNTHVISVLAGYIYLGAAPRSRGHARVDVARLTDGAADGAPAREQCGADAGRFLALRRAVVLQPLA